MNLLAHYAKGTAVIIDTKNMKSNHDRLYALNLKTANSFKSIFSPFSYDTVHYRLEKVLGVRVDPHKLTNLS